jgi:hypothetical protein
MNALPKIVITQATRLTREGRLQEAMALLSGALGGARSPTAPRERDARESPIGRTLPLLDMVPPSPRTGDAWTSPQSGASSADLTSGMGTIDMPDALRGFLDRMGQPGASGGLNGLVGRPAPVRPPIAVPDGARLTSAAMPMRPEAGPTSFTSQAATPDGRCPSS